VEAKQGFIILMLSTLVLAACRSGPTSDVEATVQAEQPTATPAPGPTSTPGQPGTPTPLAPTDTPAPVPTATHIPPTSTSALADVSATSSALVATEDEVLRVRGGPGTDYAILGRLGPGTELTLLARSSDGGWFQIAYPADSDGRGWVIGEFLGIQGSPDGLPIAQAPPTPAPTSAATVSPSIGPTASDVSGTPPISATSSALVATEDEALRVRGGPGTDYAILGRLGPGTEVALLARSSDGGWFQIAYPAGSDERGWVAGEFLEIQGSPDGLPVAQASPTTPSSTVQAVDACAPISDQDYGALTIASAPTDRPAASHPDLNLDLRGYAPTDVPNTLTDLAGATDPAAPELRGMFGDKREPAIMGAYQVYDWDWNANARGPLIGDPEVTLLGLQTTPEEIIDTPDGGGDLGEGYVALVLYASPDRITLKYTREDNVVHGYTLHIENVCVEPTLLALYQQMNDDGRSALPAVRPGEPLGRATGPEIGIVVRDKGSFLDPRSRKDWWSGG
jgi:uncharacterized protein YraI